MDDKDTSHWESVTGAWPRLLPRIHVCKTLMERRPRCVWSRDQRATGEQGTQQTEGVSLPLSSNFSISLSPPTDCRLTGAAGFQCVV